MKIRKIAVSVILALVFTCNGVVSASTSLIKKEPQEVKVPIIMYHLITKNGKYQGKYGITPEEMESDLKYLSENGYETILMSDLIKYVNSRRSLPEKPIVLTFDDGNASDYNYLFPLLEKYKMKAVLSIVGKFVDDSSEMENKKKPYMDWEQIKELSKSGIVEIQNHSYDLHKVPIGSGKKKGESPEAYQTRLREDLSKVQKAIEDNTGFEATTFTYPLGVLGEGSTMVLKELGIQASLSCNTGYNTVKKGDPECLYLLKRNIRKHRQPIASVLGGMAK